jgi:hypothetical protein
MPVLYNIRVDQNEINQNVRFRNTCWIWGSHIGDYDEYCFLEYDAV